MFLPFQLPGNKSIPFRDFDLQSAPSIYQLHLRSKTYQMSLSLPKNLHFRYVWNPNIWFVQRNTSLNGVLNSVFFAFCLCLYTTWTDVCVSLFFNYSSFVFWFIIVLLNILCYTWGFTSCLHSLLKLRLESKQNVT